MAATEDRHLAGTVADGGGSSSMLSLQKAMVDALDDASSLATPSAVQVLTTLLERRLSSTVREARAQYGPRRQMFFRLVMLCTEGAEATDALAEAVTLLEGDSHVSQRVRMLCDEWLVRSQLPPRDLENLKTIMARSEANDVQSIAKASMQPLPAPLPTHCTDAWSILLHLMRRNAPRRGLPPFMVFLEYLAAAQEEAPQRDVLQRWTDERAAAWGLQHALTECRDQATVALNSTQATDRRTMFVLMPDGLQSDAYVLRVWHHDGGSGHWPALRDDDARVRRPEIAGKVATKLLHTLAVAAGSSRSSMTLEFWLPVELVNQPVWDWCKAACQQWQGTCKVVVRSLDRLQRPGWDASLRAGWASLMSEGTRESIAASHSGSPVGLKPVGHRQPLVLSSPPDKGPGRQELLEAISSGVPAVLWHRLDCSDSFQRMAQTVVQDGPLRDLPGRVEALRMQTGSDAAHLALLWDDPDRPLPALNPLVAPDEVAAE